MRLSKYVSSSLCLLQIQNADVSVLISQVLCLPVRPSSGTGGSSVSSRVLAHKEGCQTLLNINK